MSTSTTPARTDRAGTRLTLPIAALAFVIALAVQLIGQAKIDVGIGAIVIFPMVWGLILGLLVSVQKFKPLGLDLQRVAAALVGVAVLLLVARLAFNIGPSLPTLLKAGPALLLQEVGHLLGTIALALPLAVLLRMGKATVGATFSLDREPSFAMVSEVRPRLRPVPRRPGHVRLRNPVRRRVHHAADLPHIQLEDLRPPGAGHGRRRGVRVHDGSVLRQHHRRLPRRPGGHPGHGGHLQPDHHHPWCLRGIYLALPLADRFYRFLTRRQTREEAAVTAGAAPQRADSQRGAATTQRVADTELGGTDAAREAAQAEENRRFRERVAESSAAMHLPLWLSLSVLTVLGIGTASVAAKGFSLTVVAGYAIMLALVLVSIALAKLTKKISAIVYITTIGAYISSPWFFGAAALAGPIKSVDFLSIATVMLTLAGLSLGKDIPLLKNIGWKIIPVGLVAVTASFLLSTVIAEFALGLWH